MTDLLSDPQFWQALSGFAWPAAIVIVVVLLRRFVAQIASRENLTIKVAGMEISVAQAAQQAGKGVTDLQERLASLETEFHIRDQPKNLENNPVHSKEKGFTVLWVDDYPMNNAFLIERFEQDGIRVLKEISTDSAVRILGLNDVDVIISDLGRVENGTDNPFAGVDLLNAIRPFGVNTPILIFAGQRGMENREKLIELGASQVTASPIDVFKFVNDARQRK